MVVYHNDPRQIVCLSCNLCWRAQSNLPAVFLHFYVCEACFRFRPGRFPFHERSPAEIFLGEFRQFLWDHTHKEDIDHDHFIYYQAVATSFNDWIDSLSRPADQSAFPGNRMSFEVYDSPSDIAFAAEFEQKSLLLDPCLRWTRPPFPLRAYNFIPDDNIEEFYNCNLCYQYMPDVLEMPICNYYVICRKCLTSTNTFEYPSETAKKFLTEFTTKLRRYYLIASNENDISLAKQLRDKFLEWTTQHHISPADIGIRPPPPSDEGSISSPSSSSMSEPDTDPCQRLQIPLYPLRPEEFDSPDENDIDSNCNLCHKWMHITPSAPICQYFVICFKCLAPTENRHYPADRALRFLQNFTSKLRRQYQQSDYTDADILSRFLRLRNLFLDWLYQQHIFPMEVGFLPPSPPDQGFEITALRDGQGYFSDPLDQYHPPSDPPIAIEDNSQNGAQFFSHPDAHDRQPPNPHHDSDGSVAAYFSSLENVGHNSSSPGTNDYRSFPEAPGPDLSSSSPDTDPNECRGLHCISCKRWDIKLNKHSQPPVCRRCIKRKDRESPSIPDRRYRCPSCRNIRRSRRERTICRACTTKQRAVALLGGLGIEYPNQRLLSPHRPNVIARPPMTIGTLRPLCPSTTSAITELPLICRRCHLHPAPPRTAPQLLICRSCVNKMHRDERLSYNRAVKWYNNTRYRAKKTPTDSTTTISPIPRYHPMWPHQHSETEPPERTNPTKLFGSNQPILRKSIDVPTKRDA